MPANSHIFLICCKVSDTAGAGGSATAISLCFRFRAGILCQSFDLAVAQERVKIAIEGDDALVPGGRPNPLLEKYIEAKI